MMEFRTAKAKLIQILGDSAAGQFRVAGHQAQGESSIDTTGLDRLVRVFFEQGDFPRSASAFGGPVQHEMQFGIHMIVTAKARGDLTTLNDPSATAGQLSTALADFEKATDVADESFDELLDLVYQILMDNRHHFLDTSTLKDDSEEMVTFGNRWVQGVEKDEPMPRGDLVTLTGSIRYTAEVIEEVTGADALSGEISTEVVDVEVQTLDTDNDNLDTITKTGIISD